MKIEFEKEYLEELYYTGKTSDKKHRFQPQIIKGYIKCVHELFKVDRVEDLFTKNALHYKVLEGNKAGISAVRINDQYRLEFEVRKEMTVTICSLQDITNHYKK